MNLLLVARLPRPLCLAGHALSAPAAASAKYRRASDSAASGRSPCTPSLQGQGQRRAPPPALIFPLTPAAVGLGSCPSLREREVHREPVESSLAESCPG